MRAILAAGILLLAAGCGGASGGAGVPREWQTITSQQGKYSVRFPGKPRLDDSGDQVQWIFETQGGNAVFLAGHTTFSTPVALDTSLAKKVLDQGLAAAEKSLDARTVSSKDLMVDGKYPARDVDMQTPTMGIYRARVIVTEEGIYQVVVMGPKKFVDGQDARTFRESFKISQ